jgi:hypothetical protein
MTEPAHQTHDADDDDMDFLDAQMTPESRTPPSKPLSSA